MKLPSEKQAYLGAWQKDDGGVRDVLFGRSDVTWKQARDTDVDHEIIAIILSAAIRLAERLAEQRVRTTLEVWPGVFHVFQRLVGHIGGGRRGSRRRRGLPDPRI